MRYIPNQIVNLYNKSPIWTRNTASSFYGFLKNRKENTKLFWQCLAELKETQWWSLEKLQDLQSQRLKKLIKHCAENVPYYQKKFAEYGIIPSQIQTPGDLEKLPTLSKETVRKEARRLIAKNIDVKSLRMESTSGTTGTPLTVWLDDQTYAYHKAVQHLQHQWAGYRRREWIGLLAGYRIIPLSRNKPPFWIINYSGKQVHFSSYHLNPAHLPFYVKKLLNSKIKYLSGYPSTVGLLAQYVKSKKYEIPLSAVFLSSEPILPWQRIAIKQAFKCPIFDYYGQAERVVSATSCGYSNKLHINMEIIIHQFRKHPVAKDKFTLLGTSLVNYAMPLIRYEINDITSKTESKCKCGRNHPLLNPIETKMEDYIITPKGSHISASILTFPFKNPKGIIASQIVQESRDFLLVKVVPNRLFTKEEEIKLKEDISSCVGNEMRIEIQRVAEIPRTKNGKFRFVVSQPFSSNLFSQNRE